MEIQQTIKSIKQRFHLRMDGVASASMREKGAAYKINWGLKFSEIREIASDHQPDYDLALALWKEDTRECKILATLLMPHHLMPYDMSMLWIEQCREQEIAEYLAFNLLQYSPDAATVAFHTIARNDTIAQICGYNILSGLIARGNAPTTRDTQELLDQALSAMQAGNTAVSHAALNCLNKLSDLSPQHQLMVDKAIDSLSRPAQQ